MPEPLETDTHAWLPERARHDPDLTAIVHSGGVVSFLELDREARKVTTRLTKLGVGRGDHLAVAAAPGVAFVALLHAAQRIGAAITPLDLWLTGPEIESLLADVDPRVLLHDEAAAARFAGTPTAHPLETPGSAQIADRVVEKLPRSQADPAYGGDDEPDKRLETRLDSGNIASAAVPIDPEETLTLLYTSGTTGAPKGVRLPNRAHFASALAARSNLGSRRNDRWLCTLPLHHVGGLSILVRSVVDGVPIVLHPSFDADAVVGAIRNDGITLVSVIPTMLSRLLDAGLDRPHTLRAMLVGGAALPAPLLERARSARLPVLPTYGLTETCSQVVTARPGAHFPAGSSGVALRGVSLRIDSPDTEGTGEIVVGGAMLFSEYHARSGAARPRPQGELRTGDIGRLDYAGNLFVLDRRTDRIVTGGENVSPTEVEAVLSAHPNVVEVAVFGVADAEWGQRVVAVVVPRKDTPRDEAALRDWASGRLARFKVPREVRFVGELPRTASGKLQRHRLHPSA